MEIIMRLAGYSIFNIVCLAIKLERKFGGIIHWVRAKPPDNSMTDHHDNITK